MAPSAAAKGMETGVTGTAPLLTVSGLSLSYGRLRALDDVNLNVQSGELVALAGENGAGKTTLVRCIAGDAIPASGEIYLGGRRVPADPAGAARRESPRSGRTWRCATTWTSRRTSCSAGSQNGS